MQEEKEQECVKEKLCWNYLIATLHMHVQQPTHTLSGCTLIVETCEKHLVLFINVLNKMCQGQNKRNQS